MMILSFQTQPGSYKQIKKLPWNLIQEMRSREKKDQKYICQSQVEQREAVSAAVTFDRLSGFGQNILKLLYLSVSAPCWDRRQFFTPNLSNHVNGADLPSPVLFEQACL